MRRRKHPNIYTVEDYFTMLRMIGNRLGKFALPHPDGATIIGESLHAAQDADEPLWRAMQDLKDDRDQLRCFQQNQLLGMYWAQSNFPVFRVTADLAAALALTECSGTVGDNMFPFPAFLISLANGSPISTRVCPDITVVGACHAEWFDEHERITKRGINCIGKGPSMKDTGILFTWQEVKLTDKAEDIVQLMGNQPSGDMRSLFRLIFNLAAYLTTSRSKQEATKSIPRKGLLKDCDVTAVGRDVKISASMRNAARGASAQGANYSLKTRHVRRGHFRNQPHGPGNTLRKRKWIAPMWIGPDIGEAIERGYTVS